MKLPRREFAPAKIMLTPLLDIFTTLLVFLIVTFHPEDAKVKKSSQIKLPQSTLKISKMPKVQVEVTKDYVKVNGVNLQGLVPEQATTESWSILKTHLEQLRVDKNPIANMAKDQRKEPVLILADKATSFKFVDRTVAYLAAAGYSSIYLAAEKKGDKAVIKDATQIAPVQMPATTPAAGTQGGSTP